MKRIVIVTSVYTGAGHKSISDALMEQFAGMPDVEANVLEGFDLLGRGGSVAVRTSGGA